MTKNARFRNTWQLHAMMVPGMTLLLVFNYVPLYGLLIAFKDFLPSEGIMNSPWVGLANFEYVFQFPDFWQIVGNTVFIATAKMVLGFPVPIIVALLLNEVMGTRFKKLVQTVIYLPNFLSWVVLSGIIIDVFALNSGLVNRLLSLVGVTPNIFWLGDNGAFISLIIGTDIWKNFGLSTVIFLASITAVDTALYEAAAIDGANRWRQTISITLPAMMPIVILMGVLSLGNILNAGFEQIFNLYNPLVYESSDIIDTFVYRLAFEQGDFALSTAVGLIRSVVSTAFILLGWKLAMKYSDYKIF